VRLNGPIFIPIVHLHIKILNAKCSMLSVGKWIAYEIPDTTTPNMYAPPALIAASIQPAVLMYERVLVFLAQSD